MKYKLDIQYFGLKSKFGTIGNFVKDPANFGKYKTDSIYNWLKKDYDVKPLSKGKFAKIPYKKVVGLKWYMRDINSFNTIQKEDITAGSRIIKFHRELTVHIDMI